MNCYKKTNYVFTKRCLEHWTVLLVQKAKLKKSLSLSCLVIRNASRCSSMNSFASEGFSGVSVKARTSQQVIPRSNFRSVQCVLRDLTFNNVNEMVSLTATQLVMISGMQDSKSRDLSLSYSLCTLRSALMCFGSISPIKR